MIRKCLSRCLGHDPVLYDHVTASGFRPFDNCMDPNSKAVGRGAGSILCLFELSQMFQRMRPKLGISTSSDNCLSGLRAGMWVKGKRAQTCLIGGQRWQVIPPTQVGEDPVSSLR